MQCRAHAMRPYDLRSKAVRVAGALPGLGEDLEDVDRAVPVGRGFAVQIVQPYGCGDECYDHVQRNPG